MSLPRFWHLPAVVIGLILAVVRPSFSKEPAISGLEVASLTCPSQNGIASWYGRRHVGRRTANGEIYSPRRRTVAHRDLPFGTFVRITNLTNGLATVAKVNDRGPFVTGRIIDLSEYAARDLAMLNAGLASVRVEVLPRD